MRHTVAGLILILTSVGVPTGIVISGHEVSEAASLGLALVFVCGVGSMLRGAFDK